jgi:ATP-dependent Lon protease
LGTDITGRKGIILIVECNINPKGQGKVTVTGAASTIVVAPQTPIKDESVIESATNAVNFIKKYLYDKLKVDISKFDFVFQVISPLEGAAGLGVSGPSLGAALSTAAISELAKVPIKPESVMTGKADIKGNVGPVGGTGWRGTGKFLAAAKTKKMNIKKFLLPIWNYEMAKDEIDILTERNIKVIPINKQIQTWIEILNITEKELIDNLKKNIEINN